MSERALFLDLADIEMRLALHMRRDDWYRQMTFQPEEVAVLVEIARAAQEYRRISLADPTSLDRPPAGSRLDAVLATLDAKAAR
jgi:hypothetical protein